MKILASLFLTSIIFFSCDSDSDLEPVAIQGYWVNPIYSESDISYSKSAKFNDGAGIAFLSGGNLIERANSGWCGTPPISYAEYEGHWSVTDTRLIGQSSYWGGNVKFEYQIVELTSSRLVVKVVRLDYQ